jgi:hypothetical protein
MQARISQDRVENGKQNESVDCFVRSFLMHLYTGRRSLFPRTSENITDDKLSDGGFSKQGMRMSPRTVTVLNDRSSGRESGAIQHLRAVVPNVTDQAIGLRHAPTLRLKWTEKIERRPSLVIVVAPSIIVTRMKDDWHSIMNRIRQLISLGRSQSRRCRVEDENCPCAAGTQRIVPPGHMARRSASRICIPASSRVSTSPRVWLGP